MCYVTFDVEAAEIVFWKQQLVLHEHRRKAAVPAHDNSTTSALQSLIAVLSIMLYWCIVY